LIHDPQCSRAGYRCEGKFADVARSRQNAFMSMAKAVPAEAEEIEAKLRWRAHALPVLLLMLLPILASLLLLAGLFDNNPALFFSFLGVHLGGQLLHGAPGWLDPTISLLTQPLGRLGAQDWLRGVIPWWNPFTGIGMPLAAEMQTLSFFLPFVLLLKFWQGWLWMKVILQIISGIAMYALLIELGCRRVAAFVPGLLFALNGSFFLVPHAMGPIPFLPLLLLGVERAAHAARNGTRLGWGLIPLALAYSLYAGYPEVAYIDGLLVACWTLWRFASLPGRRLRFAGKVALGSGIGLALSLPLIVPFLHYVQHSYLGAHDFLFSIMTLRGSAAPLQIFPLAYGAPGTASPIYVDWAELGGWFGLPAIILALAALIRPGAHKGLVRTLFGFAAFWQARLWGVPPAIWLADLIPDLAQTDSVRFAGVAMEAAVFIMAGLGIDSWLRGISLSRGRILVLAGFMALIIALSFIAASPSMMPWYRLDPGALRISLAASGAELMGGAALLALLAIRPSRRRALLIAVIIGGDAFMVAFLPQLSAPRTGHLDLAGVAFLQRHQGLTRSYTLQPFGPDYPAAFGLASINDNALPVARSWSRYIKERLDPYGDVVMFTGAQPRDTPGVPDQAAELRRHLAGYAATGVKYLLATPGDQPFRHAARLPAGTSPHALALGAGQSVSGTIPAGVIRLHTISIAEISIGTFAGAASGMLDVRLCAGVHCAVGRASLDHAPDGIYLPVRLDHDLAVPVNGGLRYRVSHESGSAVALWLGPLAPGAPASLSVAPHHLALPLRFLGRKLVPGAKTVFRDQVMTIYRLPHDRRFYSTSPECALSEQDLNHLIANCLNPARLLRLEAWFPGWHVRLNGKPAVISRQEDVFQSVQLAAGRTRVSFFYRPRGTFVSVALALAALLLWLGLMINGHRISDSY
jgi:hypothetical protein